LNKIKKYYARLYILEILSENKYFLFLKIKFIYTKDKKNIDNKKISSKIKYIQNN
jgi:hypothetical protein